MHLSNASFCCNFFEKPYKECYNFARKFLNLLVLFSILFILASSLCDAREYHDFSEDFFSESGWDFGNPWRAQTVDGDSFLSGEIICGQKTSFSVNVNYNEPKCITFNWYKRGPSEADLICYYDDNMDSEHLVKFIGNHPKSDRIMVKSGRHVVKWEFSVSQPCNGVVGSTAEIDDIVVPDSIPEFNCTILTNSDAKIGQVSSAFIQFSEANARYDWQISSGGVIMSPRPFSNQILWKATKAGVIEIKGNVISSNGPCTDLVKCNVTERDVVNVTDDMDLSGIIGGSENKIFCLTDGNYTDGLVISGRNIMIISKNRFGAVFDTRGADYSIVIDNTSDVYIEGINITDCDGGFIIYNSTNCTLANNSITSKMKPGIFIDSSSSNLIKDNILLFNSLDDDQGIRFNNSSDNIISNNTIFTDDYSFLIDNKSNLNTFNHNFANTSGIIFNCDERVKCKIACNRHDKHMLSCINHSENRIDCIECTSCDIIGAKNKWKCI